MSATSILPRMTTLIVTLPPEPHDAAGLYDYVRTLDTSAVAEHSSAPLAMLPQAGADAEVVALVPPQRLSWFQVQLPKGILGRGFFQENGATRLRAVLEGLLEDRLLDETAQLHFALEPEPKADAPVWVAACDRAWLRAALQALEQSGRAVSRVVPEFAPDALDNALYVMGEPDDARMVFTESGAVVVWPLTAAAVALVNWPESSPLRAEPAVAALAEQLFKRSVSIEQPAQRRVQALQSSWDLAQFDLVNSNSARTWKQLSAGWADFVRSPRWRAARFAMLALLLVNLAGLNAWAWKEKSRLQAKRVAVREVLTTTFPKVQVVVDAPLQMAKEVAAMQQSSGVASGRDMETMMSAFWAVAPANTAPSAIEFIAGELRMKGLQLSAADIADLSFKLQPQGYGLTAEADSLVVKLGQAR
jgi:general secretion pathway protein L